MSPLFSLSCTSSLPRPLNVLIRKRNEDENCDDDHHESERAGNTVPLLRLPHSEPLAPPGNESDLPEQEPGGKSRDGKSLCSIKGTCIGVNLKRKQDCADPAQNRGDNFSRNDQGVSRMMQRGSADRPIPDRGKWIDRVHGHDVLHESEIGGSRSSFQTRRDWQAGQWPRPVQL